MTTSIGDGSAYEAGPSRRGFLGRAARLGVLAAGGTVGLALTTGSASAHSISGGWSNNHVICNGCSVSRGNIVKLWQSMLWSFNTLGTGSSCGTWVDGIFGPNTARATRNWQAVHNLTVDGIVGPQTWSEARSELDFQVSQVGYRFFRYPDPVRPNRAPTWFRQNISSEVWQFKTPGNVGCITATWLGTGH